MSKIASHDSWSFAKPAKLYMYIFNPFSKCQEMGVVEQFKNDVRCFDMRVRFDTKNDDILESTYVCHGLVRYKTLWDINLAILDSYAKMYCENVYVRVLFENQFILGTQENYKQAVMFKKLCAYLEKTYPNLIFFGGTIRKPWGASLYTFKSTAPTYDDKYSSVDKKPERKKYKLFPKLYAKKFNKINIEEGSDKKFTYIDFINIQ